MPSVTYIPPGLTTSALNMASGGTNNYVMTAVDGDTIQGEANLTFDSTDLILGNGGGMVIGHTAQIAGAGATSEFQILGSAFADSSMICLLYTSPSPRD